MFLQKLLASIDSEPTGSSVLARVMRLEPIIENLVGKGLDAAFADATGQPMPVKPTPPPTPTPTQPTPGPSQSPKLAQVLEKFAVSSLDDLLTVLVQAPAPRPAQQPQQQQQQPQQPS